MVTGSEDNKREACDRGVIPLLLAMLRWYGKDSKLTESRKASAGLVSAFNMHARTRTYARTHADTHPPPPDHLSSRTKSQHAHNPSLVDPNVQVSRALHCIWMLCKTDEEHKSEVERQIALELLQAGAITYMVGQVEG